MTPVSIGILAVSMSIDAFIAALGRGAVERRPRMTQVLRTGALFGVVEAITPLLGWLMGVAASRHVQAFDHWIAFGLLAVVGLHMAWQALQRPLGEPTPISTSIRALLVTAIGTSIDAMAVGVSLAFLDVNIVVVAVAIGLATAVMSSAGLLAGGLLGRRFGRVCEVLGGLALFALGLTILIEHLTAG